MKQWRCGRLGAVRGETRRQAANGSSRRGDGRAKREQSTTEADRSKRTEMAAERAEESVILYTNESGRKMGAEFTQSLALFTLATCAIASQLFAGWALAVAPTIDYSHNMRILKLPKSVRPGELVYRLKGFDADPNSRLNFGVSGLEGRALLDVVQVADSWNEADVYLRAPLIGGGGGDPNYLPLPSYNLTVYVSDGNKSTQVESTLLVTNDDELDLVAPMPIAISQLGAGANRTQGDYLSRLALQQAASTTGANSTSAALPGQLSQLSPFLRARHVFNVPENAAPGEAIGSVSVRESDKSDLPVRFELRGQGAERFAIKYVFGPRGQSRGELTLAQALDYERQNLYALKVLALNAWTNTKYDTRNVASLDIVITVGDVQDTAPQWRELPHSVRLPSSGRAGDSVARVRAEDGDYGDQRPLAYALDAASQLASFFTIDKQSGEIKLARPVDELVFQLGGSGHELGPLVVIASELPDASSYDHLWPPMFARAELPLVLVDVLNEPPRFVGGWQTRAPGPPTAPGVSVAVLHGFIRELQSPTDEGPLESAAGDSHATHSSGQLVQWYVNASSSSRDDEAADSPAETRGRPLVLDLGQGSNGTFELSLEGPDAHLFELEPKFPVSRQSIFNLQVARELQNRTLFDAESGAQPSDGISPAPRLFQLDLVARDFGSPQRLSARVRCQIELLDVNDNAPQFDSDLYVFSLYENAPPHQVIGAVRARDPDVRPKQRVRYSSLTGRDSHLFKLDQDSGVLTLAGSLDREHQDLYLLLAEARDAGGGQAANLTRIMVKVLDVNDNAPIFTQPHYDAVLQADGSFVQPLVVRALDADEPNSASSQVAYEIIAGNQNDQFSIDALSGAIFLTGSAQPAHHLQLPPALSEPIVPFGRPNQANSGRQQLDSHGRIKPAHEVEESTVPSQRQPRPSHALEEGRAGWPRRFAAGDADTPLGVLEQLPASLELLLGADSGALAGGAEGAPHRQAARSLADVSTAPPPPPPSASRAHQAGGEQPLGLAPNFDPLRVPPLTTLVVRAHDFGIPLRSATCKVNIYNQALLSRPVSVILNGTAEQVEQRREQIERAFGALTASKAQIESIDALSDSSSISVARLRLAIPAGHSLIDLTDLSSLMAALDYRSAPPPTAAPPSDQFRQAAGAPTTTHYIAAGDRLYPVHGTPLSNISGAAGGPPAFYTDIGQFSFDSNMLERKLLFYIIIVGICILALLVIWMIYFCCREDQTRGQLKVADPTSGRHPRHQRQQSTSTSEESARRRSKHKSSSKTHLMSDQLEELEEGGGRRPGASSQEATQAKTASAIGNNLAKSRADRPHVPGLADSLAVASADKTAPDHYSMYNGQVWFEQGGLRVKKPASGRVGPPSLTLNSDERRASSAPSAGNSLDSSLHAAISGRASASLSPNERVSTQLGRTARGQFFPNTIGYMENLNSIERAQRQGSDGRPHARLLGKRQRRRKIVPMALIARAPTAAGTGAALDLESGGSGGLVLVPAASLSLASEGLCQIRGREHPGRRLAHGSGRNASASSTRSTCSSSSEAPHTLAAGSHESIFLDSDQELLGFDSTGTPIIATHTRRPPTDAAAAALLSEALTGSAAASAAPTVIRHAGEDARRAFEKSAGPRKPIASRSEANPPGSAGVAAREKIVRGDGVAETNESKPELSKSTIDMKSSGGADGGGSGQDSAVNNSRQPASATQRRSLDLMGELSERLASNQQRQRELRRQSASEEPMAHKPSAESHNSTEIGVDPNKRVGGTPNVRLESKTDEIPTQSVQPESATKGPSVGGSLRRASGDDSLSCQSSASNATTVARTGGELADMKNGELLEKQSIFALTYSGLATEKLPA